MTVREKRESQSKKAVSVDVSDQDGGAKTVAAVERALDVLDAFLTTRETLSLAELAERTGLYKSTILRLTQTLAARGYILRHADGAYQVGAKPFRLGAHYQRNLRPRELIMPVLERLSDETGESASFNIVQDNVRVVLFRVDSKQIIRDHLYAGDVRPMGLGSAGRVLTTFAAGARTDRPAGDNLLAVAVGEIEKDMAGIGAPVFGLDGDLAGALSVSGPRFRFTPEAVQLISRKVLEAAAELTQGLGGPAERFDAVLAPQQ
ncbi:MAG: IclR family transcriptional regulator [Alcaligenaceae bacterium]|nr:IclR family transcriptional regulator [Alcaligenaceae bacterium SAGV5]MPS51978.1 IclR family transcriptional regulator [Alcaligenaceae bacterium SAGV3]MPT60545.1 IclR family transcriptional regulator [Alcaligenaceae bacterium]